MEKLKIDKLFIENFKSYQDKLTEIKFGKKITLIFGKNSAGKSSLIQALGLIQQSIKYKRDLMIRTPDTDSSGIKSIPSFESILPNQDKNKSLTLGVQCSSTTEISTTRTIIKKFEKLNQNRIMAKEIDLYAPSEKLRDNKTLNTQKFLSVKNTPFKSNSNKLANIFASKITYSNNEGTYYEMYDLFNKHRDQLILNLSKIVSFKKKFNNLQTQLEKLEKKKKKTKEDNEKISNLTQEIDEIFEISVTKKGKKNAFKPFLFVFSDKQISKHAKFLEKKSITFDEFVNYVSKDEQNIKELIYYDSSLISSTKNLRDLAENLRLDKKDFFEVRSAMNSSSTIKDLLCYVLSAPFTAYPQKSTIVWNENENGKVVTPEAMFESCSECIKHTLSKLKIFSGKVQVPETFSAGLEDEKFIGFNYENLHEVLRRNIGSTNKYLKKFGFDIKAKIHDIHDGKSILSFQKKGITINLGNAGLGIENILPIITQSLASKDEILFFEEPERRAHPQLQADLADLFVESVNKKNNNQIIIETHSENMLLGFLKNIRESNISHEDVQILYVYLVDGKSDVQHLEVDEQGRFKEVWRDGFFTERLNLI